MACFIAGNFEISFHNRDGQNQSHNMFEKDLGECGERAQFVTGIPNLVALNH